MTTSTLLKRGLVPAVMLAATALVMPFEGKRNKVYLDPANILTSCWGHTGRELKPGMRFSDDQCLDQLVADLSAANRALEAMVDVPLSDSEHAAYLSFIYNAGAGRFQTSTMRKHLNAGKRQQACQELLRWVYINKQFSEGLARRRQAEARLCQRDL